ncbi:MAG: cytochrome c, partial [Gemmataceae bacterium]|nr:cytochrome c [Gemmataceae bacterium]
ETMTDRRRWLGAWLWAALALTLAQSGHTQPAPRIVPRLEPIAETKLLMTGLAHANLKGLERSLVQQPADPSTWTFARSQALLIAEAANLFMLRPPPKEGQYVWFEKAMTLRSRAAELAQALAAKDYDRARTGLSLVADGCNRCHDTFRVPVQIELFVEGMP